MDLYMVEPANVTFQGRWMVVHHEPSCSLYGFAWDRLARWTADQPRNMRLTFALGEGQDSVASVQIDFGTTAAMATWAYSHGLIHDTENFIKLAEGFRAPRPIVNGLETGQD